MAAVLIDVAQAEDRRDVVHRIVQALAEGKLVALPTETVYCIAAGARCPEAVARLIEIDPPQPRPFMLAIRGRDEALDYVPEMSPLARRVARRCWPGPVSLVLDNHHPESLLTQLAEPVQRQVTLDRAISLGAPDHELIREVLRMMPGPLVLRSATCASEGQPAVTAAEAAAQCGDRLDLVIDDGRTRFGQPASVLRVSKNRLRLLSAGLVGESHLRRLVNYTVLLVCTGNTCRSPMAEVLAKSRFAQRLGCETAELEDRGVLVMSAGIAAMPGGRATLEAVEAMRAKQLDLTTHESQPVSDQLVDYADVILTMTARHRDGLLSRWPEAASRTFLLSQDGSSIGDPIGGPPQLYARCAEQIDAELAAWIASLDLDAVIPAWE